MGSSAHKKDQNRAKERPKEHAGKKKKHKGEPSSKRKSKDKKDRRNRNEAGSRNEANQSTELSGPASAEKRKTCLANTKFLIVAEPRVPDEASKEEKKQIKDSHKKWLKETTATLKEAGATVASKLKGEGDKAVTHVLSTRVDYADQPPEIVQAVSRGIPIMNYSFVSESLYAGHRVAEKPHLLTPFVPEMEVFESDIAAPPTVKSDQRILQDLRAEAAVSLTRHGQRLTVALAQNQNEVHVVAGSKRLGWGIAKAARRTGALAGAGGSTESGPLWSIASSWAPCCAGEGSRTRKRTVANAKKQYAPAGPPFARKLSGHDKVKPLKSRVLMAPDHRVTAFTIDPDTDALYTGSDAGGLVGWDLSGGVAFWALPPTKAAPGVRPVGVNVMQICKQVLSVTFADGAMKGLDPHSGAELWSVEGAGVTTLTVAGGIIYMGCYDKTVRAVEAHTGIERWSCEKHTDVVRAMAHGAGEETHVSGEEKVQSNGTLYTGGWDQVIRALDDQTGKQKWRHKRHRRPIASLSVSCGKDGGSILFSGSYDGTCRAIRTTDGTEVWKYNGHTQPVRAVCATALDPGGMRKKAVELENYFEMLTGIDLDGDGDVGVVDRVGVVFTGSEDGTVCALEGCSGEALWTHARHTRRVVEVTVCDGIVFTVADDQTTRAIAAKTGQELWCSRWAWGRHGPPPDRGSIWTKAVNWTEKKTGLDLDGDGDVGVLGGDGQLLEKAINRVEMVTGLDLDRDGDVGQTMDADAALTESLRSLGLSDTRTDGAGVDSSCSLLSPDQFAAVERGSPLLLSPLPGSPSSPLPTTEELIRQLHGFPPSPGYQPASKVPPGGLHTDSTPREVLHARDVWEDAKDRVAALEATIAAEKESVSWAESDGCGSGKLAEKIIASRSSIGTAASTNGPSRSRNQNASKTISMDAELHAEWKAAQKQAAQLESVLVAAGENLVVGQQRQADKQIVDRISSKIKAIYRLKDPRKLDNVPGLMDEWAGEEEELLRQIEEKYRVDDGDLWTDT